MGERFVPGFASFRSIRYPGFTLDLCTGIGSREVYKQRRGRVYMEFCRIAWRDMYVEHTQVLIDDGGMMHGLLADLKLGGGGCAAG